MTLSLARVDALAGMAVLIDVTLKGAAVLVMAGLADALLLRRSSAAMRHLLWSVAVAALLALPALALLAPGVRTGWLPDWSAALSDMAARPEADLPAPPSPTPEHAAPVGTVAVTLMQVPAQPLPTPAPIEPPAAPSPAWLTWAILAWAAGVGLLLTPLLAGLIAVAWRVRRAASIDEPAWQALLGELRTELGISRPVRLLRARAGEAPMTWGVRHPAILLPPAADEWPQPCRRAVLVHELAHIRRGDCLTQLLARAVRAIHWHNPLAWLAVRNLRIQRERACDDVVLACGTKASDYASHLLEIVRSLRWPRPATMAAVAMARPSQFEGRLMAILDACRNRRHPGRTRTVWLCLLATAVALSIASARSRSASPAVPAEAVSAPPASTQPTRAPLATTQVAVTVLAPAPVLPPDAATVQAPGAELPTLADLQPDPDPAAGVLASDDVVDVSILELFSEGVETTLRRQITDMGTVDLPKLPGPVRLAGLTLEQARKEVARAYTDAHMMLETPEVSIRLVSHPNKAVNVIGAVARPGQYPLAGANMRLLDALAMAGDVTQTNVKYVYVLRMPRRGQPARAPLTSASASSQPAGFAAMRPRLIAIELEKLMSGDPGQNIVLHGRDTITVPRLEVGEFYVMGEVSRPGVYSFTGRRVTMLQAIIAAGGDVAKLSESESSRPETSHVLIRRLEKDREVFVPLNLAAIIRGTEPDIYLKPNDVIAIRAQATSMPAATTGPAPGRPRLIAVPPPAP